MLVPATARFAFVRFAKITGGGDSAYSANVDRVRLVRGLSGCDVRKTATQSVTGGSWVKYLLDNETYDYGACFASSKFTVKYPGSYMPTFRALAVALPTGQSFAVAIYKNGALLAESGAVVAAATSNQTAGVHAGLVDCVAGDYIEAYVKHDNGSALNIGLGGAGNDTVFTCAQVNY